MTRVDDAVRKKFRAGEPLDLRGTGGRELPELRAETLAELLTEDRAARRAVPAAWLAGVRIVGELQLAGAVISTPLWLVDCEFDERLDLEMARLEGLSLTSCRLPGLLGANLRVAANLTLRNVSSSGTVSLNDAQIGGTLRLDGAQLRVPGGYALFGERLEVRGALYARRMRTEGEVRIPGARVIGNVNLGGSRLVNSGGDTLDANGIDVSGSFLADRYGRRATLVSSDPADRFVSEGRMLLAGARIGGDLVLSGAQISRQPPTDDSVTDDSAEQSVRLVPRGIIDAAACLVADRVRVEGNLELDDEFRSSGTVRLPNAVVGGYLRLSGAELGYAECDEHEPNAVALLGDGMEIGGDLEARRDGGEPLAVTGQFRLAGARVRGSVSMSGVTLTAPGGDALFADAMTVGSMFFLRRVTCAGTIRMGGARIGSSLDCGAAVLTEPPCHTDGSRKPSLDLRAVFVGKDVFCNDGFVAEGGIRLRSAEVVKSVVVNSARLGSENAIAFNGYGLITQELMLRPRLAPVGEVRLSKARVGSWSDNAELWQCTGGMTIDGFDYQALGSPEIDVVTRLKWLKEATPGYDPGAYEQLATAYRRDGEEEKAERVLMARQRRRYALLGVAGRVWGELQRWTVGFGYRPWLAVCWLSLFWVLGGAWFAGHPLTPIDSGQNPVWNPWLYAADTLIPIVNLGADGYWRAQGSSQWISSSLVVVGWILASTAASGAARVLKRS